METLSYCQLMQRCGELEAQLKQLATENAVILQDRAVILEAFDDTCVDIGMRRGEMAENYPIPQTPATDTARAALRAEGVDIARNALIAFVEDEVGSNENVPGLIRGAEVCVSIARQLRESKGAQS